MEVLNIYCDESCHLQNDQVDLMAFGAFVCPLSEINSLKNNLLELKLRHGLSADYEIKWNKVSNAKVQFFKDVIDYIFSHDNLKFRTLVVPEKSALDHERFESSHSEFYYKMYFLLLRRILQGGEELRVYLDKKDTIGGGRTQKLHEVLCNDGYDFDRNKLTRVQIADSKKMIGIQIADFLLGAVAYANRKLESSDAKNKVVEHIRKRSGKSLISSTPSYENKFNIFLWEKS